MLLDLLSPHTIYGVFGVTCLIVSVYYALTAIHTAIPYFSQFFYGHSSDKRRVPFNPVIVRALMTAWHVIMAVVAFHFQSTY